MASDGPYEGYLYLCFSLYAPPEYDDSASSSPFTLSDEVEYWLVKEFLCGSNEITSIRLVQDTLLTNTCLDQSYSREENLRKRIRRLSLPPDMVVIWNSPTSTVTEHYLQSENDDDEYQASLQYTSWNISFPVFDWGSTNKSPREVQRDVQHLLEQKIWLNHLGVPIDGSGVSVKGDEEDFWPLLPPTIAPSASPMPQEPDPPHLPTPRAIDPTEARNLVYIGALLIVVQTILSTLLYQYGKYFRSIQEEKEELKKDRESLDQMLRSSKGFVEIDRSLNTIDPSEPLEPSLSSSVSKQSSGKWYHAKPDSSGYNRDLTKRGHNRDLTKQWQGASHKKCKSEINSKSPPSSPSKQKHRDSASSSEKKRHSSQQKNSPQRRHSHEVGKTKKRHSHHQARHKRLSDTTATVPLRMSEGAIEDVEDLWQPQTSPPASFAVKPTGKVERRKHQQPRRSSKLEVIDDTQVF